MKRTLEQLREDAIDIPLTTRMRQRAKSTGDARAERNALCVLAVAEYLEHWQGYGINLDASDVWNPVLRRLDVADVPVEGLGRLECRLVHDEAVLPQLPPEVWYDRIGYVYVQLQPDAARLLGVVLPFDPEQQIELESIDSLLEHLARLAIAMPIVAEELDINADQRLAIVAQLERIYRQERSSRWGLRAEEVLTGGSMVGAIREKSKESEESIERQELAERLMEKLSTVWNELQGECDG
jgi:hypothetical protein